MFQIKSSFFKLPKYFRLHAFLNCKGISSSPTPDKTDLNNSQKKKDVMKNKCRFNEFNDSLSCQKSNISIGIIGSGLTAVYASLLLKQNLLIKRIHLVDTTSRYDGAIAEASSIDTTPRIKHYKQKFMKDALRDMDIIALLDECDFRIGTETVQAQFKYSVNYVREMAQKMVKICPTALVVIFARPVTATLPLVSEIYKCAGWWDPDRIVGSVALEAMRMESTTSRLLDLNPAYLTIPLAGGADASTIVPLLSASRPINEFTTTLMDSLLHKFQNAEKELALMKPEGPTISSATAVSKFLSTITAGLYGNNKAFASAYVRSNSLPICRFFTSELKFGPNGVEKNFGLPKVSKREILLIEQSVNLVNECVDIAITEARRRKEMQAVN